MRKLLLFAISTIGFLFCAQAQQRILPMPYGDMDHWVVRYIQESKMLGGHTKTLYVPGPSDTITTNQAYNPAADSPWGCSDTYAKCFGIETAMSGSVTPEKRGHGYCCKLTNVLNELNFADIYAMVSGTIYMGQALEPLGIAAKSRPFTAIDFGTTFDQYPSAIMLDYKAQISHTNSIISTQHNRPDTIPGTDCAVIYLYLQHRWEDPNTGKIYARRVGTIYERICDTIPEWQNNHIIPIQWGNITTNPDFQAYQGLNQVSLMTRNSRGKMVKIEEVGWSLDQPTHIVLYISSSNAGVFRACPGNTLWVDNLCFVYKEE